MERRTYYIRYYRKNKYEIRYLTKSIGIDVPEEWEKVPRATAIQKAKAANKGKGIIIKPMAIALNTGIDNIDIMDWKYDNYIVDRNNIFRKRS
ncbi:hypothetical protein [Sigmofec virus UA08Rod_4967]|uniref:Uncharacterized protein n=1 Tax=Sigmofec virus UA08Rod_4967 TaxID=2929413 RepID=A0A976N1M0_9VIRU|nr:hypothetical protein [Sigmofec virus UA08Rod_4967]